MSFTETMRLLQEKLEEQKREEQKEQEKLLNRKLEASELGDCSSFETFCPSDSSEVLEILSDPSLTSVQAKAKAKARRKYERRKEREIEARRIAEAEGLLAPKASIVRTRRVVRSIGGIKIVGALQSAE